MIEPKYYDDVEHEVEEKKMNNSTFPEIFSDEWWDEYARQMSISYFAEEEEMKLGIHPSQIQKKGHNKNGRKN